MADTVHNVIIIGGGPAGLAAGVYTSRANLKPVIFSGAPYGGQLMLTSEVENYPGFASILGPELIEKMRGQVRQFGAEVIDKNVTKVDFSSSPFKVTAGDIEYQAKTVVIATGAQALWLGLDSETRLRGKGVSACATCDGFFFKEKIVGVVGGGDSALEEALFLTKFAKEVHLFHRRDSFRASKIMQERVLKHPKITVVYNTEIVDVLGEQKVEGVSLNTNGKSSEFKLDGLFIAIGHKPDTDLFKGQIELDEKGYVMTSAIVALANAKLKTQNSKSKNNLFNFDYQTATSIKGVFAGGDNVDHVYRQAGTAAGMGISAALDAERFLENT